MFVVRKFQPRSAPHEAVVDALIRLIMEGDDENFYFSLNLCMQHSSPKRRPYSKRRTYTSYTNNSKKKVIRE